MEGLQLLTVGARAQEVRRRYEDRLRDPRLIWAILALLLAAAAVFLLRETRGTTLWFDEWIWALTRRGSSVGTYLRPHNSHLSLVPIAIYKLLFATVGINHYIVYRVIVTVGHLACVTLLFLYARRRVGGFLALIAATLILFLGPAWQDILWPFQIAWLISIGTGLATLLLFDRRERGADVLACLLLVISLASSSIGVPVVVGALVEVIWVRRRDAWIVAIPILLYVAWSLAYQHAPFLPSNLFSLAVFSGDAAAGAMAALFGLTGNSALTDSGQILTWGPPLAVLALLALGWRVRRIGWISPRQGAVVAMLLSFWILDAAARAQESLGYDSRYLYVSAVFILLIAAEVLRGVAVSWRAGTLIVLATGLSVLSNVGSFREAAGMLRASAESVGGELAALDIMEGHISPHYLARYFPGYPFIVTTAGQYYELKRSLTPPADTPAQLAAAPEFVRAGADAELVSGHGVAPAPAPAGTAASGAAPALDGSSGGSVSRRGGCVSYTARPGASGPGDLRLTLPAGGLLIRARDGNATVAVRRFADTYRGVGTVPGSTAARLQIGADSSAVPWRVQLSGAAQMTACGIGGAA